MFLILNSDLECDEKDKHNNNCDDYNKSSRSFALPQSPKRNKFVTWSFSTRYRES